jgi:hypothetical protein
MGSAGIEVCCDFWVELVPVPGLFNSDEAAVTTEARIAFEFVRTDTVLLTLINSHLREVEPITTPSSPCPHPVLHFFSLKKTAIPLSWPPSLSCVRALLSRRQPRSSISLHAKPLEHGCSLVLLPPALSAWWPPGCAPSYATR